MQIWAAIAVSVLGCCLYGLTLAPSFTWQHAAADSAELAAAAASFGVPHPTGYPLWLLLAAPLAHLPGHGDVAGRLGWLSAACAALAAGIMTVVGASLIPRCVAQASDESTSPAASHVGNVGESDYATEPASPARAHAVRTSTSLLAGVTAGLALQASTGVWNVAVVTETYTLHLLLVVALLGAAVLAVRYRWRALLGGLALANHVTALPVVIAALLSGHGYDRSCGDARRRLRAGDLLWLLPGISLYLILPWRAHSHPASNWGDPETAAALWRLVSGSAYHYLFVFPSLSDALSRFLATLHTLVTQFPIPFWPLAVLGLPALYRLSRLWLLTGGLYLLLPVFYRAAGVEHYLLPDIALLALAAGFGMARVAMVLVQRGGPLATFAGAGPLSAFGISPPRVGESQRQAIGSPTRPRKHTDGPGTLPSSPPRSSPPGLGERSGEGAFSLGTSGERSHPSQRTPALPSRVPWLLLALLAIPSLVLGAASSSLRGDDRARQWATHMLVSSQPGTTILTSDDGQTFALWYMQRVDHLRPDVLVIDQRLWQQPWYRRQLELGAAGGHAY